MGSQDMAENKAHSRFARYDYMNTCRKHDLTGYKSLYDEGVALQLQKICTQTGGYEFGKKEYKAPEGMCGQKEAVFRMGYNQAVAELNAERLAKRDALLKAQSKTKCHFDSDCKVSNNCRMNRCEIGGGKCDSNSDCESVGRCTFGQCRP